MGAIIDTLHVGIEELSLVKAKYPDCVVVNQSYSDFTIQRYKIIIPSETGSMDNYYLFLIDSGIAMSSRNFLGRIASDQKFVDRMRIRISESLNNKATGSANLPVN